MKFIHTVSFLVPLYGTFVHADIKFMYPSGGEIIDLSQVQSINIEWCESGLSPNITELENYVIHLYSGDDNNPVLLPVAVVNENGPVPGAPGNETYPKTALSQIQLENTGGLDFSTANEYFFGVTSQFRNSPNTSVIDFSPRFSLADSQVASSIPSDTASITDTTPPSRIFLCDGTPCVPSSNLVISQNATVANTTEQATESPSEKKSRDIKVFIIATVGAAVLSVSIVVGVILMLKKRRSGVNMGVVEMGQKRGFRRFGVGGNAKGNGAAQASRWSRFSERSGRSEDSWSGMD